MRMRKGCYTLLVLLFLLSGCFSAELAFKVN